MPDKALENAEAQRNELLSRKKAILNELVDIEDKIGQADRFIKSWYAFAGIEVPLSTAPSGSNENEEALIHTDRGRRKNSSKESVANLAREIIMERGAPISRSELYSELIKRGLVIQGKDNEMVLSTMLWRMKDRVVRLKNGGYWLPEKTNVDSGYYPSPPPELIQEATEIDKELREDVDWLSEEEILSKRSRLDEIEEQFPLILL